MGQNFKKIIFIIFFIIFSIFSINYTFWAKVENTEYISLNPQSSSDDIKKFQKFFKALKIYSWDIDGKYQSIKSDIIDFQVKKKIISSEKEIWAGYIWPKTFKYFDDKYWTNFKKAYLIFFWIKEESFKNEKCFVVSAYYSPLPWQKKYSTKSYEWDIRLNWNWTHWASWAAVHPWFIAAPSNYSFWTKVKIEWLWIWIVEDRWWAIVRKWVRGHECDRLDIWMWYWDDWLTRALKWWKKKVRWEIVDSNTKITISFPTEYIEYLAKKIVPESNKTELKEMQKLFAKAKLYSWKIDWKYKSFEKAIINFQIKNKIIKDKNDYAAGYIWPKTIKKLEAIYPKVFIITRKKSVEKEKIKENKNWEIPEKEQTVTIKSKITQSKTITQILKKYSITLEEKQTLDKTWKSIIKSLEEKYWKNKNNLKIKKNKLKESIVKTIKEEKSYKVKKQLTYLIDIIK